MKRIHSNSDTVYLTCAAKKFRPEVLFPLTDLPDEILVVVAQNLDYESLCELMLVNQRFYELVLGNRRLWSKFRLNVQSSTDFVTLNEKRRFDSVYFYEARCNKDFSFSFALDVKRVDLGNCIGTKIELMEFLQKMSNLEIVNIYDHRFIDSNIITSDQQQSLNKFTKLKELAVYSDIGLQNFYHVKTLLKLSCSEPPVDFLVKQNQLKDLYLDFDKRKSSIFSKDFTTQVKFCLEKLSVGDAGLRNDDVNVYEKQKILAKFINLHQNHLKSLDIWAEVESSTLKRCLPNLKNLQSLKLFLHEYGFEVDPDLFVQTKAANLSVTNIELNIHNCLLRTERWNLELMGKFIECFPNVRDLKLVFELNVPNVHLLKISKSCNPKLENITLCFHAKSNVLEHLKLVDLENVNLSITGSKSSSKHWRTFFSLNPNQQNLQIIDRNLKAAFFDELLKLKELRRLVVLQSDFESFTEFSTYAELIKDNCKNLDEINLEDFSLLENSDYDSFVGNDFDEDSSEEETTSDEEDDESYDI